MDRVSVYRRAVQLGSFSSVSQRHTVWSVLCPLNIVPVQADDDGSGGGIALWVASTAALPFPRGHTRIELGQQRCADRKTIETESNQDRIVDGKIESKSIEKSQIVTSLEALHCGNRDFQPFLLLWHWPWSNDLHIWTWPVFPEDILDVQIWTSNITVRLLKDISDRQTNKQKDRQTCPNLHSTPLCGWSTTLPIATENSQAWLHYQYTRRAESLWRKHRHGPVIVQHTDSVVFPIHRQ